MKRPLLVEVEWTDACDLKGNFTLEEARAKHLATRFQAGYLVHQDEKVTRLAQTWDPPGDLSEEPTFELLTLIPTAWVVRIRRKNKPDKKTMPVVSEPT